VSADAENGGAPDEPDAGEDFALVTVGRYRSPIEAQAYRMAIEQAGLRAWVSDENMGTTFGPVIGTGLEVRARDEEAALAILERKTEPRAEAAPPPPEPSPDHGRRSPVLERLELAGVLLITTAYPIASNLVGHPGDGPTSPRRLMVSACWYAGLTVILWILLRSRQDPLSPAPLPRSLNQWMREIFVGAMLFLGLWVLSSIVGGLLRQAGVRDAPSRWALFFRQPGMAPVYSLESLLAASYEEVAFRAYLISRLGLVLGKRRAWSVVVAGALFALMHGYGPRATLTVFVDAAVGYGLVYVSSRSLPRLVVAHWLHNLAVMRSYL